VAALHDPARVSAVPTCRRPAVRDSNTVSAHHTRGVVNAVIAAVTGDPMCYFSAGTEHRALPGAVWWPSPAR